MICNIYCPTDGTKIFLELGEEFPIFTSVSCTKCKRELNVKFDLNSARIDFPYDSC